MVLRCLFHVEIVGIPWYNGPKRKDSKEEYAMKKRMLTICLALCCLLTACGGVPIQIPESVRAAAEEGTTPEERLEEDIPQDPEELGEWLLELIEERKEHYAIDYDVEMKIKADMLGESMSEGIKTRVRKIEPKDGEASYQNAAQYGGETTCVYYADGMVYLESAYGNYKAPIDLEEFREAYMGQALADMILTEGDSLFGMGADVFEHVEGRETENGYVLKFEGIAPEAWQDYSKLLDSIMGSMLDTDALGGEDGLFSFEDLDMEISGEYTMDKDGELQREQLEYQFEMSLLGMTMTAEETVEVKVNGYDDEVRISVPEDDESFRSMSDIHIPEVFSNGFNSALSREDMHYQDTLTLRLSDAGQGLEDVYIQQDDLEYTMDFGGLTARWDTGYLKNDQVTRWSCDSYSGGEGVITDQDGEREYTYDDDIFLADMLGFIALYTDSFDSGSDYRLEQEDFRQCLTYTLSEDYMAMLLEEFLEGYETGVDYLEALEEELWGTVSIWFDETGTLAEQKLELAAELTYEAGVISVTLEDHGTVLSD